MKPTADFLLQAEARIMQVLQSYKPKLLAAYGNADPNIKSDATPVTTFDKELETLLQEALTKLDPGIGIEGEEHGKQGNDKTFWLIDPIDGTESFVRGLPFVRNMVTLIDDDQPVFALVYKPVTGELFTAVKGQGTYKNGQAVRVSHRPLRRAWIELSVPLNDSGQLSMVSAVRRSINGFRTIGDFTYVAEGKVEGQLIYGSGGGAWDYAPRALLVSEAGGKVTNIGSESYNYRNYNMLLASPHIFDDLMKIITSQLAQ